MIRFGIVGASGIAKKFARDILLVDNASITAVSARNEETAQKYKKEYNVEYAYASYEDLAKSKEIDAVYIATPHVFHHDQAIMFMNYGKHVLVEKPAAVNESQFLEMVEVAKKNHVLLMEAMWTHFLPASKFAKEKAKELGKLLEARLDFGHALLGNNPRPRLLKPELAGGSILDICVYNISFYHYIKKAPIKTMEAKAQYLDTGVDSECDIEITDEDGAKIYLKSSISEFLSQEAKFVFEKGTMIVHDFMSSKKITINHLDYDFDYLGEGFTHEIKAFADTLENNLIENNIMTHANTLKALKTMDKARALIGLKYPFE